MKILTAYIYKIQLLLLLVANVKSDIKEYCMKGLNPSKRYVAGVSSKSRNGESSIIDTPTIILKRNPGEKFSIGIHTFRSF